MDRLLFFSGILFLCFFSATSSASIIVTNDWASATVLMRDQKGGQISKSTGTEGAAGFEVSVNGEGIEDMFDTARAEINQILSPGYMIRASVLTDDDKDTEVEGWLRTSWSFTVSDISVDFSIRLLIEDGGDSFSSFSLYDLTDSFLVSSRGLSTSTQIVDNGTLAVGHDYIFNACLSRTDIDYQDDQVYDGISDLSFIVDTDVLLSPDRTHARVDLPGPSPLFNFIVGLAALVFVRKVKMRQ